MLEMNPEEVRAFVAANKFGMLGLASDNKSYVVPLFYGYDGRSLFFHTHPGLKNDYIARTTEACFTVARVQSLDDWASVEAFGKLTHVTDHPELTGAMNALMSVPLPPEWGFSDMGEPLRGSGDLSIFRLTPTRITGRKSERPQESSREHEIAFGGM